MSAHAESFEPYAAMSWRLASYVRRVCTLKGEPFDPGMNRGEARRLLVRLGALREA